MDPTRAIATCLKPAEDQGIVLRVWETSGQSGPLGVRVRGYSRAMRTDLLERDLEPLPIVNGRLNLNLRGHGFGSVRLVR